MGKLDYPPLSKLRPLPGERVVWAVSNPTFHRTGDYGIVITDRSLYLYSPFWLWLARWRRHELSDVRQATFVDSRWLPRLVLKIGKKTVVFRTPFDYQDDMDFDRKNLAKAAELLSNHGAAPNNSFKPTPLRGAA